MRYVNVFTIIVICFFINSFISSQNLIQFIYFFLNVKLNIFEDERSEDYNTRYLQRFY